jgi:hypothetical protein
MQYNGILAFGRNPHSAPGAMLLEMHFIQRPKVDILGTGKLRDFF